MSRPEAIYGPFQLLSFHIFMTDPLMEIFLKDTRFQGTNVSGNIPLDTFTFDQSKISELFLQLTFLLVLEGSVCVCLCVSGERMYLYIFYIQFTRKPFLPFVLLDYVGGWLFFRKWRSQ